MKIPSLLLCIILITLSLTACQTPQSDVFDPSDYISAVLDNSFTGDSQAYEELSGVDSATANENYLTTVNNITVDFFAYYELNPSDEQKEAFDEVVKTLLLQSDYSVGEYTQTENGYTVDVSFYPILNIANSQEDIESFYFTSPINIYTVGSEIIDEIITLCSDSSSNAEFGDLTVVCFEIVVDDSGYIKINSNLFDEIDDLILPIH